MKTYLAVYTGLRRGENVPLVAVWAKLNEAGVATDDHACFVKKGKKTTLIDSWIGDVYEIEEDDAGMSRAKGPRVRPYGDNEQCAKWRLEEKAAEASVIADKKAAEADYDELTLGELRERYSSTIGRAKRAALLATMIQFITK